MLHFSPVRHTFPHSQTDAALACLASSVLHSILLHELAQEGARLHQSNAFDWLQNVELRRSVHAGLNKGEARNALARAIFIHRLGEIRDRTFEQQRYRSSGLNIVTAAIVLWNTVYLERAAQVLLDASKLKDDSLQQYMSPLGWEHINLTGDYVWHQNRKVSERQFRSLRTGENP